MAEGYYDYVKGRRTYRLDPEMARELYDKGMCDRDIAKECGVVPNTVADWRRRNKLPRNEPPKRNQKLRWKSQLSIDAAEAREHGMNYGMWMAVKYDRQLQAEAELKKKRLGKT